MAQSASRVAAVNLGMQTVTMAVYEASGQGFALSNVARATLQPDPAADGSRAGQLKIILDELRRKLKWTSGPVAISIPSQGVFARFVKIPMVEPDKAGQMLFFEAQQNVPYPIEEVSWCYQVLPETEADKLGALILATKLDQLEATVESVQAAGLTPDVIETSPTALYNALRYNYPELTGCTLLIDIGARATNLIFSEGERLFIRTLPVGGNSITSALHKKFESRPFAEIEDLKVREAFIPPPGNYDTGGSGSEMGKTARMVMTRIHNEITRSITFYRTSQQGSAPVRVLLAGAGASLPYTLEFFNEKLSLPIEFFNPLRRVAVLPSATGEDVGRIAHALGECTGLAARLILGESPLQLDLQSPQLESASREKARRPFLIAAVALLAATLGMAYIHYNSAANRFDASNADLDAKISGLKEFKTKIDTAVNERKKLMDDASDLAAVPILTTAWASVIDELASHVPPRNLWITSLRPMAKDVEINPPATMDKGSWSTGDKEGAAKGAITAISVRGLYLENERGPAVVDSFVEALAESPVFDINPEKKSDVVKLRAAQSGEAWAYDYQLVLPLKRPIPL